MEVHDRIRKLRESRNLSREDFSKKIGVTYSAMSKYETGLRQPDYETLQKIADYFEVSTDYLLGRSKNPNLINYNNSSSESLIKTSDGKEINVSELTDYQQAILQYALTQEEVSFEKKPEDILEMLARFEAFYLREKELEKKSNKE